LCLDPDDPQKSLYDIDDESTIIQVGDWYHNPAIGLTNTYFATNNGGGKEPVPDSGLINGRGRYKNGPASPRAVINVTPGKKHRFRLINNSAFGQFRFSVQGHRMTIIEIDGISHQPYTVDGLDIFAAQRYSFIVRQIFRLAVKRCADDFVSQLEANQPVANYWVRAPMTVSGASDNRNRTSQIFAVASIIDTSGWTLLVDANDVFAVLHYAGAPNAEPTTSKGSFGGTLAEEYNLKVFEPSQESL